MKTNIVSKSTPEISIENEITPERLFNQRRTFLSHFAAASAGVFSSPAWSSFFSFGSDDKKASGSSEPDELTPYGDVTSYNNFYELGAEKSDPKKNAAWLKTDPWSIEVEGMVEKPGKISIEEVLKIPTEERVYRMRCVERWSMVIPWNGFQLSELLNKFQPSAGAKYVEFTSILDPSNLYGQRYPLLRWPYTEGLRLDEAMHPLTLLAVGIYGKPLLPQNGAPIRLVVPWKYGFKGIKSINKIRLTDREPATAWNIAAPKEYGFYANVNPKVHHPRWRQNTERRIGEFGRRDTLLFNGYEKEVADLYKDMNLSQHF